MDYIKLREDIQKEVLIKVACDGDFGCIRGNFSLEQMIEMYEEVKYLEVY